jgi:sn-glycerol 3-phosphate transport system substrate-binding protein
MKTRRLWGSLGCVPVAMACVLVLLMRPAWGQQVQLKYYYPVQLAGPLAKVMTEMTEDFNKSHPNIRVEPIFTGDYNQTEQKVLTAIRGGNPPDVAVMRTGSLFTLIDLDTIIPLDAFIVRAGGEKYLEDFFPAFLANSRAEGKIWSIPFQRSTPVFYWNKNLFQKAGLDPNRPPQTWAEVLEFAPKLTIRDARGNITQWGLELPRWDHWTFQSFVVQNEGRLENEAGTEAYFNSPPVVEALQFWTDLANKHRVMPRKRSYGEASQDFVAEATAMMYNSTGSLSFVKNSAKFDFGVSFLPKGRVMATQTGGGNIYFMKGTPQRNQEAAWTFVEWMTNPENVARWTIASGYVAHRRSAYEVPNLNEYIKGFPYAIVARDQLKYAQREFVTHDYAKVLELLVVAMAQALDQAMTPKEALDQAQKQAMEILAKYRK